MKRPRIGLLRKDIDRYNNAQDFTGEDTAVYEAAELLSKLCRQLFTFLVEKDFDAVATVYSDIRMGFNGIRELPPCAWNDCVDRFFRSLSEFLVVKFTVKRSGEGGQREYETTAADILSESCSQHIHAGCPYHIEDNFTHCCMCMLRILSRHADFEADELFRKSICALFHDIGKLNTLTLAKNGRVGYPCHCLAGSITLRHMWGDHFLPWFSRYEYDRMCDTVLYHMCGLNTNRKECTITGLCLLPPDLREDLSDLARADVSGAFPQRFFQPEVPCLADDADGVQTMNELSQTCTILDFMDGRAPGCPRKLKGVLIVLMGQSAAGKGHTANLIRDELVACGFPPGLIHHLQRDEYIRDAGAKLLDRPVPEVSYGEAYAAVQDVATREREGGVIWKDGIKAKISEGMKNRANDLLSLGCVVLFDTMQTYFASSRHLILPAAAADALRLYVYPVRTTLITPSDCQRHDMSFEQQVIASGEFNVVCPLNSGVKGNLFGLNPLKCVWACADPAKNLHSQNPHYVFTVSTAVRPGQQLPNNLIHVFMRNLAATIQGTVGVGVDAQLPIYHSMNMEQLLNYLDSELDPTADASRQQKTELIKNWFFSNQCTVSFPFLIPYRVSLYCLAVADGNDSAANDLRSRLLGASVLLPPTSAILDMDRQDIFVKSRQLEDLLSTCIVIKYKDGINRQWSAPWNIQSRSPICIFVQGKWRVISAMPRGPEIAGHREHGVTALQDLNVDSEEEISHFAPHYQICIRAMQGDVEEALQIDETVCSSKRDGMCFRVTFLAANSPECRYWQYAVKHIEDEVVQAFVSVSRQRLKGGLVLPASNGTALLTQREVQFWMICSLALSYGITHGQLTEAAARCLSPLDLLQLLPPATSEEDEGLSLVERFVLDISKVAGQNAPVEMHAWEAIGGPGRMCAFDTTPHTELACNYDEAQCGLCYLGLAITSPEGDMSWIPHFSIQHNFFEPTFWRMENCLATRNALTELAKVFGGEISWEDFFACYPPANRVIERAVLPDAEGFVVYLRMAAFGRDDQYVYCKAKTWMYYILHKIRPHNIPSILRMPEKFGEAFPGYRSVREFFGEGEGRAAALVEDLCAFVMSEPMINDLNCKALNAFQRVSPDVRFKLVLNNSKRVWLEGCLGVASNHFSVFAFLAHSSAVAASGEGLGNGDAEYGELEPAITRRNNLAKKKEEASMVLRSMLMTLECYNDGWRERLAYQFDIENISRRGEMPKVAEALWEFIHST